MKYIKLFEKFYSYDADKTKDFVPKTYIIFDYGNRAKIFAKIINVKRYLPVEIDNIKEIYLRANVIDYVEIEEVDYIWIEAGKEKEFNIELIETLYTSISLKDAEVKWNELAGEGIMKRNAKKYMKYIKFNENLDDYKSKIRIDLMNILDAELYTEDYYDGDKTISTDGKKSAIKEIINYLEKEGILTELSIDAKKYNV